MSNEVIDFIINKFNSENSGYVVEWTCRQMKSSVLFIKMVHEHITTYIELITSNIDTSDVDVEKTIMAQLDIMKGSFSYLKN